MRQSLSKNSFTLIELLVVIAIIGLLSTVVLVSLQGVRARARDARRKSDLKQIRTALEEYYNDHNTYPPINNTDWVYSTSQGEWIPGLGIYMNSIPVDPINNTPGPWNNTGNYSYAYGWHVGMGSCPAGGGDCSGQSYDLVANLENTGDSDRCLIKQWIIHTFAPGASWCGSYSGQLYSDH